MGTKLLFFCNDENALTTFSYSTDDILSMYVHIKNQKLSKMITKSKAVEAMIKLIS